MEVTKNWQDNNIWFLVLKGPLLSYRLYGDPTCRISRDLDFLVKPEDIGKIVVLLTTAGYQPEVFEWPSDPVREKFVMHNYDQYGMVHPDKNDAIEIHWKLFKHPIAGESLVKEILDRHTEEIWLAERAFTVFSIEFELLYLIIHGGLHAWSRLKWLVDIHELANHYPINEEIFKRLVTQLKAQRLVVLCEEMMQEFFSEKSEDWRIGWSESRKVGRSEGQKTRKSDGRISGWYFRFSLSQTLRESDIPHSSVVNFLKFTFFRMQAFPGIQYKLSALSLLSFSTQDMNVKWLPANKVAFMLYRPVGYMIRSIRKLLKEQPFLSGRS